LRLAAKQQRHQRISQRWHTASPAARLAVAKATVSQLALRLAATNPKAILQRGYAWVENADGAIIADRAAIPTNARLTLRLRDGAVPVVRVSD
jgi:exodeoxyribonuclease VII large subunit